MSFDTIIMVDWSARSKPSPAKPAKDAIYIGVARDGVEEPPYYYRTRAAAHQALIALLDEEMLARRRVLAGFDFPFGYPRGFARALTGTDDPLAIWQHLHGLVQDDDGNANNRWDVAEALNARFPGVGPFWGCPATRASTGLPARGSIRTCDLFPEKRRIEACLPRAQPCWKLFTTGSVGSQVLLGLPRLHALRMRYGAALSVSPFQPPETPIVLAEIYPGLIDAAIKARGRPGEILDAVQVRLMARAFARLDPARLDALLREGDAEEGWILGFGAEDALIAAL